ncbi:MAG: hypothetical protein BGO78_11160 [Chloroflexi bacterium 44-23]|nr:MAG: hypothetical protein BGO78_11160 [Chloroflexi bacterium 44-23]
MGCIELINNKAKASFLSLVKQPLGINHRVRGAHLALDTNNQLLFSPQKRGVSHFATPNWFGDKRGLQNILSRAELGNRF